MVYAPVMQAHLLFVRTQPQLCTSVLQAVTQAGDACSAAMCALGGCISYLRQLLLDRWARRLHVIAQVSASALQPPAFYAL